MIQNCVITNNLVFSLLSVLEISTIQEAYIEQIGYFFLENFQTWGTPIGGVICYPNIILCLPIQPETEEICEPPKRKLGRIWSHIWRDGVTRLRFSREIMSLGIWLRSIYHRRLMCPVFRRVQHTLLLPSLWFTEFEENDWLWFFSCSLHLQVCLVRFQNCNCRVCLRRWCLFTKSKITLHIA